jgi:hypothetical protein
MQAGLIRDGAEPGSTRGGFAPATTTGPRRIDCADDRAVHGLRHSPEPRTTRGRGVRESVRETIGPADADLR